MCWLISWFSPSYQALGCNFLMIGWMHVLYGQDGFGKIAFLAKPKEIVGLIRALLLSRSHLIGCWSNWYKLRSISQCILKWIKG